MSQEKKSEQLGSFWPQLSADVKGTMVRGMDLCAGGSDYIGFLWLL